MELTSTTTVNKPPQEVYGFWRRFENLPRFMKHLESVKETSNRRTHWIANGPAGVKVEWDAEITNERPNECISWRSLENADIDNSGTVRFERATGGRGTIVRVTMYYSPPAAGIGTALASGQFAHVPILNGNNQLEELIFVAGLHVTVSGGRFGRSMPTG